MAMCGVCFNFDNGTGVQMQEEFIRQGLVPVLGVLLRPVYAGRVD